MGRRRRSELSASWELTLLQRTPQARLGVSTPRTSETPPSGEGVLKKPVETPATIRHRKIRCGKMGVVDMISAAFGRSFCFFSPKQRPARRRAAPSDGCTYLHLRAPVVAPPPQGRVNRRLLREVPDRKPERSHTPSPQTVCSLPSVSRLRPPAQPENRS